MGFFFVYLRPYYFTPIILISFSIYHLNKTQITQGEINNMKYPQRKDLSFVVSLKNQNSKLNGLNLLE